MDLLTINKAQLKMGEKAKFLGVIFESALTVADHVKVQKKRLDLVHTIAGS